MARGLPRSLAFASTLRLQSLYPLLRNCVSASSVRRAQIPPSLVGARRIRPGVDRLLVIVDRQFALAGKVATLAARQQRADLQFRPHRSWPLPPARKLGPLRRSGAGLAATSPRPKSASSMRAWPRRSNPAWPYPPESADTRPRPSCPGRHPCAGWPLPGRTESRADTPSSSTCTT